MPLGTVLLLSTAVVCGIVLALWHLRPVETRRTPPWQIGILHGALGIGGLAALILLLQGPRRGDAMGVGSFGTAAAWLFAAAIAAGLTIPFLIRRFRTTPASPSSVTCCCSPGPRWVFSRSPANKCPSPRPAAARHATSNRHPRCHRSHRRNGRRDTPGSDPSDATPQT